MLIIRQDSKLNSLLAKKLLKVYGESVVKFNTDEVASAIDSLVEIQTYMKSRIALKNTDDMINYLREIKAESGKNMSIRNIIKDDKITSIPIRFIDVPNFKICTSDYTEILESTIVRVDFTNLINAITFELAHNDYDVNFEDIEKFMGHIGVIATYDGAELKWLLSDVSYIDTMGMMIGDTDYTNTQSGYFTDYFGKDVSNINKTKYYTDICRESYNKAMAMICIDILDNLYNIGIIRGVSLLGVYDNSADFIVDREHKDMNKILEIMGYGVAVRIFGRLFEFNPTVHKL